MGKKKLLYINNFEAPYRVPFFNLLGEKFDLTLVLTQRPEDGKDRNAKWFAHTERNYKVVYLNTTKIAGVRIAFDIRKMLMDYELIFMDMYGNPTNMYAIFCMNRMKKKFLLSVDGMLPRKHENPLVYMVKKYCLKSPELVMSPGESVDSCLMHYGVPKEKIVRYHFTSLLKDDVLERLPNDEEKRQLRIQIGLKAE